MKVKESLASTKPTSCLQGAIWQNRSNFFLFKSLPQLIIGFKQKATRTLGETIKDFHFVRTFSLMQPCCTRRRLAHCPDVWWSVASIRPQSLLCAKTVMLLPTRLQGLGLSWSHAKPVFQLLGSPSTGTLKDIDTKSHLQSLCLGPCQQPRLETVANWKNLNGPKESLYIEQKFIHAYTIIYMHLE